jgi:hypothetical protein
MCSLFNHNYAGNVYGEVRRRPSAPGLSWFFLVFRWLKPPANGLYASGVIKARLLVHSTNGPIAYFHPMTLRVLVRAYRLLAEAAGDVDPSDSSLIFQVVKTQIHYRYAGGVQAISRWF